MSISKSLYKAAVHPVVFRHRNPEDSHEEAKKMLKGNMPMRLLRSYSDIGKNRLSVNLGGKVHLDGPIGLAAGFDKNAEMLSGLSNLFDYITVGTMLPYPWPGNPKAAPGNPNSARVVRLEKEEGMLNCLGFPFEGLDATLERIGRYSGTTPVSASIAIRPPSGSETMRSAMDKFALMLESIAEYVPSRIKMVEANFASPNTNGLSIFLEKGIFEELSGMVMEKLGSRGALAFVKLPPHLDSTARDKNIDVARRWMDAGGDGITIINTIKTADSRLSMGVGGKSGKPIYDIMMSNLKDYRKALGFAPIINAVGGITADRAPHAIIEGGADTIQVYTPFIYHGPTYVRDAKSAILGALSAKGFSDLGSFQKSLR